MTGKQVAEWEAYYCVEPWGEYQEYWRAGLIASMIANALKKEGKPPARPEDFIPQYLKSKPKKQDWQTQKDIISASFGAISGNKYNPIPAGKKKRARWLKEQQEKKHGEHRRTGSSDKG